MPVPSTMQDLATLASSNFPTGAEAIGNSLDNYLRSHAAIVRSIYAVSTATIASASTTDLATSDGERVIVTGNVAITSLGTGFAGCKREVIFSGTPTLTHSISIFLPGAANITVVANDVLTFRCAAAGQWVLVATSRPNVATALGYTPINKAGDTGIGALSLASTLTVAGQITATGPVAIGSSGTIGKVNVGGGRSFFGANTELFALALGYTDVRAQAGQVAYLGASNSGTPDFVISNAGGTEIGRVSNAGLATFPGGMTPGAGSTLSLITVSSAAPGALAAGTLYLRY